MPALSLLFFFLIECSVLMALVFYNKGMLEKLMMQRTQQFLDISISKEPQKNTVKCSACSVVRKIEIDCFCRNLPISNDPVVKVSRNLAKE